ncbi:MAG: hypothetical protein JWP12_3697 [Bacteroidetes bacterium]|nr:hypothetical protein [Bacteroidota bacterium]
MKFRFSLLLLFACSFAFAQNLDFKKNVYQWPDAKPDLSKMSASFAKEDVVIIDENVQFFLVDRITQTLKKNCVMKINSVNGSAQLSTITLPESFDVAADKYFSQQGLDSKTKVPYIYKYKIVSYAARILKPDGKVVEIPIDLKLDNVYWTYYDGRRLQDYLYHFANKGLEAGDVLEYNYEVQFQGQYGYNLFYFNNELPKQNLTFEVRYSPVFKFEEYDIVCNANGADSALTISSVYDNVRAKKIWIYTYHLKNLAALNYPINSRCGKQLPHLFMDLSFVSYYGISHVPTDFVYHIHRGPKFEWIAGARGDSIGFQRPLYDKQHAAIRKFLTKIPADASNEVFYRSLCDSLNSQKFVSNISMRYGENPQYAVSSGEWLVKGKLMEEQLMELYWELLNEKHRPTYFIKLQDKRLGELQFNIHSEYKYEHGLYGLQDGKVVKLILPRFNGLQYNAEELPFYMEGSNAAVSGTNYQYFDISTFTTAGDYEDVSRVVNFIKTPGSSENENVRTENGVFRINLDSANVHADLKENLNGQFSTIIRPLYAHDIIDSTVNPVYFKKCTDKPHAKNVKIKPSYSSNSFPFKHSYNCSEDLALDGSSAIPLSNWFSFTLNTGMITQLPNFDYYVDFKYSDVYNYMLQFNKPVDVKNSADFKKSLNNAYFEVTSSLTKQSDTSYLLSVSVKIKQDAIPKADGQLLVDFVKELQGLNSASLQLQ